MLAGLRRSDHQDEQAAARYFQLACEDGKNPNRCSNLGFLYKEARGVEKDYGKAFELFKQACAGKSRVGCANRGNAYLKGEGTTRDREKAIVHACESCTMGWNYGCEVLEAAKRSRR